MKVEINNKTKKEINLSLILKATKLFLKSYRLNRKEVSIALVGDSVIRKLNRKYLGLDKTTDVLAFGGEKNFLGEIIINYPQIKRQAKQYGNNTEEEMIMVLVHGLLHLEGYDDRTVKTRERMEKLTNKFISLNFKCKKRG